MFNQRNSFCSASPEVLISLSIMLQNIVRVPDVMVFRMALINCAFLVLV